MIISQQTRDHIFYSQQPHWYQRGEKQSYYKQTNKKDCDSNCTYVDKQLIAQKQSGKIQIQNSPIEVDNRQRIQLKALQFEGAIENQTKQKFKENSRLNISGNGKRIQTVHYIDKNCPQYKKKKQQNQSSEANGNEQNLISNKKNSQDNQNSNQFKAPHKTKHAEQFTSTHQSKASNDFKSYTQKQSNSSKGKNGKEALALAAIAVGGYVGSYFILKKSFEEERQRPKHEENKVVANVIVQSTCATGGTIGGAIYGASIGAVAGPVGAFIGAGFGMLTGSALGYGLKKIMPWNW